MENARRRGTATSTFLCAHGIRLGHDDQAVSRSNDSGYQKARTPHADRGTASGPRDDAPTAQRNQPDETMLTFGQWQDTMDRDATAAAYRLAEAGGVDTCDCASCRNFRLARVRVFPSEFLALLDKLGIDPSKDGEVYRNARLAPGLHDCMGWFHFIGTLDKTGDFAVVEFCEDFTAWMCSARAPRLSTLKDLPAVQLEFHAGVVPWLLDEPEPI